MKSLLVLLAILAVALAVLAFRGSATVVLDTHTTNIAVEGTKVSVVGQAHELTAFPVPRYARVGLALDTAAILWAAAMLRRASRVPPLLSS